MTEVKAVWYTPEEKLPEDGYIVVATVSGKHGHVTYDHAFALCEWYNDGLGWSLSDAPELEDFVVHAWCDLEPYEVPEVEWQVEALPSAQPERKTGQLKYESAYNWFRCNVCRKIYPSEFMQYFDSCQYQPGFNFCPNCGADMRGEEDG